MTRTATIGTVEQKALDSICYFGTQRPDGTTGHAPTDFTIGEIVVIHSRGGWRSAVVTKIGASRITAVYTTDGAIKTAGEIIEHAQASLVRGFERDRETTLGNWDWYKSIADGARHGTFRDGRTYEYDARTIAEAERIIAENPDRDAFGDIAVEQSRQHAEATIAGGMLGHVSFTTKAVPAVDVVKRG